MKSCTVPLFFLAKRRLGAWVACLIATMYLLYAPLHGSNLYDFHYQPLGVFFLWLTRYFLEERRDRWAALSGRWAPDLQTFVAQALRHTGNLDNFLVQPAALDHHSGAYGLLECSITAAELAMNPCHRPGSYEPLPPQLDELEQLCSVAAFLFDLGKVFDPRPREDTQRRSQPVLVPYSDLSRCWRSSWKALNGRNPVLAAWMYHVGRSSPSRAEPVEIARRLVHNAIKHAWRTRSSVSSL